MEISAYLRSHARTLPGKAQLIISAYAKALEVIPRTICDNAGLDATDVLNKLRMLHARGDTWAGVSVDDDVEEAGGGKGMGVADNMERFVWEPALVKVNALEGATEAACVVLSVDETVRSPSSAVRPPPSSSFLSLLEHELTRGSFLVRSSSSRLPRAGAACPAAACPGGERDEEGTTGGPGRTTFLFATCKTCVHLAATRASSRALSSLKLPTSARSCSSSPFSRPAAGAWPSALCHAPEPAQHRRSRSSPPSSLSAPSSSSVSPRHPPRPR